jgi:hypothetical protein
LCRDDFALAAAALWPHSGFMAKPHPYEVHILADLLSERRFRWTVCEGVQIHVRSPHSYATRREAETEAKKTMLRFAKAWLGKY